MKQLRFNGLAGLMLMYGNLAYSIRQPINSLCVQAITTLITLSKRET